MDSWPEQGELDTSTSQLGVGFRGISDIFDKDSLFDMIRTVRDIAIGYDQNRQGILNAPNVAQIVRARSSILHDLLSSPEYSIFPDARKRHLHDLCRLSLLSFMLLVLFPLPRIAGLHNRLAHEMTIAIESCTSTDLWAEHPALLLWAVVLGGILAQDTPQRAWFIEKMSNSAIKHSVSAWPMVKDILRSFLWLSSECDEAGLEFWIDVCKTNAHVITNSISISNSYSHSRSHSHSYSRSQSPSPSMIEFSR